MTGEGVSGAPSSGAIALSGGAKEVVTHMLEVT
jgi:hypothetical protein